MAYMKNRFMASMLAMAGLIGGLARATLPDDTAPASGHHHRRTRVKTRMGGGYTKGPARFVRGLDPYAVHRALETKKRREEEAAGNI